MMLQLTLATAAGGVVVADAEGVGVVQVALGLAEAVAVVDGVTVGATLELAEVVGITVDVGVGVALGGAWWWWRRHQRLGIWAAVSAALVVAETLGAADSVGMAVAVVAGVVAPGVAAGVVVPGVAEDETQAAPRAASLVLSSFAPECDVISIPATTPSTATSIPAIAPRRARGRSSNTW
jgi:hypothetical protein